MPSPILTPLIIATALFMENLDGAALATALPAMAADLGEDPVALKLALTSYLLALAVFIPASGWAADRFGARKVFRAAIVVFTAGSILCGLSGSLAEIVGARVVQGLGGAMMVPVGRLVLLRTSKREELVRALAYLTVPALIGPVIGPPLGGFLATYLHWRYIFWINVPIGALGVALVTRYIPDLDEDAAWPFDLKGFLLCGASLSCLVFGSSIVGRGLVAPTETSALLGAGAAALALYALHARRAAHPIIDLSLLAVPTFRAAVIGGFVFRLALGASPFLVPLLLQTGFGLTPFQSGSLTFVTALGAMTMKTAAKPILRLFGFRRVLVINALLSLAFFGASGFFTQATPQLAIMAALGAGGFFRSLQFTALNAIAFADISREAMSRAASFAAVAQQLALSCGVTLAASALEGARAVHGGALRAADFQPAFLLIAALSAACVLFFWRLAPEAGDELAGRKASPEAA